MVEIKIYFFDRLILLKYICFIFYIFLKLVLVILLNCFLSCNPFKLFFYLNDDNSYINLVTTHTHTYIIIIEKSYLNFINF